MFKAFRRVQVAASDFPRSRRFYGETLALPEIGGFESDWIEFGLGPIILKLVPLRPGEVPSRNQVAAVLSTDVLDQTLTHLKERGVTVTRSPIDEFTGRTAEILDPDGYRIVVFQPSELHPDEEWVPMSQVDDVVKQKLLARRQKERAKSVVVAPKKAAEKKKAPEKKAKEPRAAEKAADRKGAEKKGAEKKAAAKPAPKKPAPRPAGKPAARPAEKKAESKPKADKSDRSAKGDKSDKKGKPAAGAKKPAKKAEGHAESAARRHTPEAPRGQKS